MYSAWSDLPDLKAWKPDYQTGCFHAIFLCIFEKMQKQSDLEKPVKRGDINFLKYFYMFQYFKQNQRNGAMEPETIQINGASSKSHTSRRTVNELINYVVA